MTALTAGTCLAAGLGPEAKVWLQHARPQLQLVPQDAQEQVVPLPFTGKVLHRIKAQDLAVLADGRPTAVAVAFDGTGAELADGGKALQAAEWLAEWQARGGIQPALWQHLQEVTPDERIPVAIWLRTDEPQATPREELQNPYAMAAELEQRETDHAAARSVFLEQALGRVDAAFAARPGVPLVTAELTMQEIIALAWLPSVGWIDWLRPQQPQAIRSSWFGSALADPTVTGKYGANISVCVIEPRLPQFPDPNDPNAPNATENPTEWYDTSTGATAYSYRNSTPGQHARAVYGALQSSATPNGYASSAHILFANYEYSYSLSQAGAWCIAAANYGPASVWNMSASCNDTLCPMLADYWGSHSPYPTVTIPSGNFVSGGSAAVTNFAWNSVTVGGSDDIDSTANRGDDAADPYSAYINPTVNTHADWELPNVVAPSVQQIADGQTDYSAGTSLSSAQVAGIAAQIHQTNTNLKQWPEPVRALIECSADLDVDNGRLDMGDAVDDKDGAGEVDGLLAVQMAASTNRLFYENTSTWRGYDYGYLCNSANSGTCFGDPAVAELATWSKQYHLKWDPTVTGNPSLTAARMRVVMTWAAHASCSNVGYPTATCANDSSHDLDADMDIRVFRHSDNVQMGVSATYSSNWEFIEFVPVAGVDYDVQIRVYRWSAASAYYGIAWNTATYPAN